MDADHVFVASLEWTGNRGTGTSATRAYGRDHVVSVAGKAEIRGSAARVFHGDLDRWNPEEMLIAALAQCHLLSYLCLLYTSPSPRDGLLSRMPSSA